LPGNSRCGAPRVCTGNLNRAEGGWGLSWGAEREREGHSGAERGRAGGGARGVCGEEGGAILHNLSEFYAQFGPIVGALLVRQRAPLEKELRDAVRLAKWTTATPYSLAAAVERSRRQLVRVRRKWDEALRTRPWRPCGPTLRRRPPAPTSPPF